MANTKLFIIWDYLFRWVWVGDLNAILNRQLNREMCTFKIECFGAFNALIHSLSHYFRNIQLFGRMLRWIIRHLIGNCNIGTCIEYYIPDLHTIVEIHMLSREICVLYVNFNRKSYSLRSVRCSLLSQFSLNLLTSFSVQYQIRIFRKTSANEQHTIRTANV